MSRDPLHGPDDVRQLLPHRPPFLFVDRVVRVKTGRMIVAERDLRADEPFFAGHFPDQPMMPGVLVTEALAQTAGLLWGLARKADGEHDDGAMFYLGAADVKFVNPAWPGQTLELTAHARESFGRLYKYDVEACAARKTVCKGSLTLARAEERA